jgi:hypothetical protein
VSDLPIDTLLAGRELDQRIEGTVFGHVPCEHWELMQYGMTAMWHRTASCPHSGGGCYWTRMLTAWSTSPAAAWALAERFWSLVIEGCEGTIPRYTVTITARSGVPQYQATGETFPLAMCRAAIKAKAEVMRP